MELMANSPPKEQAYGAASARVWREKMTERASLKVGATTTSAAAVDTAVGWVALASASMLTFSLLSLKSLTD